MSVFTTPLKALNNWTIQHHLKNASSVASLYTHKQNVFFYILPESINFYH